MTVVLCTTQSLHGMASIRCDMDVFSIMFVSGWALKLREGWDRALPRPSLWSHLMPLKNGTWPKLLPRPRLICIRQEFSCSPLTLCKIAGISAKQWPCIRTRGNGNKTHKPHETQTTKNKQNDVDSMWNCETGPNLCRACAKHQYRAKYHERGAVHRNNLWRHPTRELRQVPKDYAGAKCNGTIFLYATVSRAFLQITLQTHATKRKEFSITMLGNRGHKVWNRWILFHEGPNTKNIDGT